MAGHPRRIHDLHPTQFSFSTFNGGLCFTYFKRAQGRRLIITDGYNIKGDPAGKIDLESLCRSMGFNRVRVVDPYDLAACDTVVGFC